MGFKQKWVIHGSKQTRHQFYEKRNYIHTFDVKNNIKEFPSLINNLEYFFEYYILYDFERLECAKSKLIVCSIVLANIAC